MKPTHTIQRLANRYNRSKNEDGSLLLVILFTLMMTALILVITASVITGLNKTKNSRDYATALQAADTAFANVEMTANMGYMGPTAANTVTSGTPRTLGTVTWKWTATRINGSTRAWDVIVEAKGKNLDRHFEATLKGTQVKQGYLNTAAHTLRYVVAQTQNYEYGFFGQNSFNVTADTQAQPDIDGYNSGRGIVGSGGNLTLGNTSLDRIIEFNWTTDSGRCSGTYCPVVNGGQGYASVQRIPQAVQFRTNDIDDACATNYGAWRASTNAINPLVAGRCYTSMIFDTNFNTNIDGIIFSQGDVNVLPGVTVNASSGNANVPASRLRIETNGNFATQAKAQISMAVLAKGNCSITAPTAVPVSVATETLWSGAATCANFTITGSPRLRYDGGLQYINDTNSRTTGYYVWDVLAYTSID